jgi:formyltetrahydrofolate deformylase
MSETSKAPARPAYILTLSCPDRIGIVAAVSAFFVEHRCNILESAQFGDADNGRFFYRTAFEPAAGESIAALREAFAPICTKFAMDAAFYDRAEKVGTIVMVSKFGHCLNDLLYRSKFGGVGIDIRAIVSNHQDFRPLAEAAGIPFHHLPVEPANKAAQEAKLMDMVRALGVELIVLARYMQVLSPAVCAAMPGRVINIHHSFLPSFKGAKPYHSAHDRGVKLIGATAHYVTPDLDEGPIIEQAVERVHHGMSVADYIAVGRDVEAVALGRAVKWHAERRILLNGARTVIFD